MNISLVKQANIRGRILDKVPEIIEARKLKKEIAKIIVDEAKNNLSDSEKFMYENYPKIMMSHSGVGHLRVDGKGFCDKPITNYSYWSWTNVYSEGEVFKEVYFSSYKKDYDYFNELFNNCPDIIYADCSGILNIVNEETKLMLKDLVSKFINCLREAEKKMSRINTILTAKEISLNDIKKHSPKLYNIIKLEL